jgi:glyoxylase-like metal-dependent hydrolase (beta-lactamase superfamily II)
LIDTGGGSFGPSTGRLYQGLLEAGASPTTINWVILTHIHPDHIGGCTDQEGHPLFPMARYIISRVEWEFWRGEHARPEIREFNKQQMLQIEYDNLPSIVGQVQLVEGETEILPGISVLPSPGHTPGQLCVLLHSHNRRFLYLADTFFHPVQVHYPHWSGVADLDAAQTVQTRLNLLEKAVHENILLMSPHFPFPGLGWVVRHKDGFFWLEHKVDLEAARPYFELKAA